MERRCEPCVLRRLYRPGRAFAEGTVEHDAPVADSGELAQHAAGADIFLQVAIGRMQRARNSAVLDALTGFAQIHEGDVGAVDYRNRLLRL
jgi:hypothetical protein